MNFRAHSGSLGDEHRDGVDEGRRRRRGRPRRSSAGPPRSPTGQVADEDVGPAGPQGGGDVDRLRRGLLDRLAVVLAEPVEGRAPLDGHVEVADARRTGWCCSARRRSPCPGRCPPWRRRRRRRRRTRCRARGSHRARRASGRAPSPRVGVPVVLDALDQRAGAVPDAGDRHPDLAHGSIPFLVCRTRRSLPTVSPLSSPVRWCFGSLPLGLDQPVEPGDVLFGRLGGVLHQ